MKGGEGLLVAMSNYVGEVNLRHRNACPNGIKALVLVSEPQPHPEASSLGHV